MNKENNKFKFETNNFGDKTITQTVTEQSFLNFKTKSSNVNNPDLSDLKNTKETENFTTFKKKTVSNNLFNKITASSSAELVAEKKNYKKRFPNKIEDEKIQDYVSICKIFV